MEDNLFIFNIFFLIRNKWLILVNFGIFICLNLDIFLVISFLFLIRVFIWYFFDEDEFIIFWKLIFLFLYINFYEYVIYFFYIWFFLFKYILYYFILLLLIGNVWWLIDFFLGRFSCMLIVFIGLNVLLKIFCFFGNDKFLLYKMFFVVIKIF